MVEMFDGHYGRYSVIECDAGYEKNSVPTPSYSPRQESVTAIPITITYGGFEITIGAGEQVCGTDIVLSEHK